MMIVPAVLMVTTILSFIIGNLLGAVSAWPKAPNWLRSIATPFVLLTGVPPVIMGVLLLFFIGFRLKLLPLGGPRERDAKGKRNLQSEDLVGRASYEKNQRGVAEPLWNEKA